MKLNALLCSAAILVGACGDEGTSPPSGSGVEVTLAALNLSNVTYTQYTITVRDSANTVVSTAQIDSDTYQVGADPSLVRYVAPCDATLNNNTVTVAVDAITAGTTAVPANALPPDQVKSVACVADESVQVDFSFHALASAELGFFDIVIGTGVVYCAAKLDCETSASTFFPASADGGLVLGFACTADNTADADTVLHMDDIVVNCGAAGVATIIPDVAGNLAAGKITGATTLIDGVTVFRGEDVIGTSADNVYWNVAIGLTDAATAATCQLTTHATATSGATVQQDAPYVAWNVPITDASDEVSCSEHPLFSAEVDAAWPAQGDTEVFDHLYTGNPTVFVSSAAYIPQTNFTGRSGADALCAGLATTAGLPGTFVAWLSDGANDAKDLISTEALRLVNGTRVVLGRPDLLDGSLAAAIDLDENGVAAAGPVWTGTLPNGTKAATTCSDWTTTAGTGTVGTQAIVGAWTDNGTQACNGPARLICIQVP